MNPGLPVMSVGLPAALFFFITNLQGRYNCLPVPVWSVFIKSSNDPLKDICSLHSL